MAMLPHRRWRPAVVLACLLLVACSTGSTIAPPSTASQVAASATPTTASTPAPTIAPTIAPTAPPTPSPTPTPIAVYEVLGWSTASDAIDTQQPDKAPAKLIKAGGSIKVCGKDRLVFWIMRADHDTSLSVYLTLKKPSGEVVTLDPRTYPTPDGVIDLWWGYTDGPLDARDKGSYRANVAVGSQDNVVATATVKATC